MKVAHVAKHKVVVMGVNRLEGMRGKARSLFLLDNLDGGYTEELCREPKAKA